MPYRVFRGAFKIQRGTIPKGEFEAAAIRKLCQRKFHWLSHPSYQSPSYGPEVHFLIIAEKHPVHGFSAMHELIESCAGEPYFFAPDRQLTGARLDNLLKEYKFEINRFAEYPPKKLPEGTKCKESSPRTESVS